MALEIDFESAHKIDYPSLMDFFAHQVPGEALDPDGSGFFRTPGIDVTPYVVDPGSPEEQASSHNMSLGFSRRVQVRFRLRATATEADREEGWALMLRSALAFINAYPDDAVLLYNGEQIILARRNGETVFDTWEGLDDDPAVAAIVARYPRRPLPQPFL